MRWMGTVALAAMAIGASPARAQAPEGRMVGEVGPDASSCLTPVEPGTADGGDFGGFRNSCNTRLGFTWCVMGAAPNSWGGEFPCEPGKSPKGVEDVGPNSVIVAHVSGGTRVHWFACPEGPAGRSGAGPAGIWGPVVFDGSMLRGKCRVDRWEAAAPKPRNTAGDRAAVTRGEDAWRKSDYATAVEAWRGPAAAGNPQAQYLLGRAYLMGSGVPKDQTEGVRLTELAAEQGNVEANKFLGLAYRQSGRKAEAVPYLERAAAGGDEQAQYVLGMMLLNGDITPSNPARGRKLLEQAAAKGMAPARSELARRGWAAAEVAQKPAPQRPASAPATRPSARAPAGPAMSDDALIERVLASCQSEVAAIVAWNGFELSRADQVKTISSFLHYDRSFYEGAIRSAEDYIAKGRQEVQIRASRWHICISKTLMAIRFPENPGKPGQAPSANSNRVPAFVKIPPADITLLSSACAATYTPYIKQHMANGNSEEQAISWVWALRQDFYGHYLNNKSLWMEGSPFFSTGDAIYDRQMRITETNPSAENADLSCVLRTLRQKYGPQG